MQKNADALTCLLTFEFCILNFALLSVSGPSFLRESLPGSRFPLQFR
jgi:hypothetical protein